MKDAMDKIKSAEYIEAVGKTSGKPYKAIQLTLKGEGKTEIRKMVFLKSLECEVIGLGE